MTTVVINELPQVASLCLILSAGLAWVEGDLVGGPGLVLSVLTMVVLTGHVELARRGISAGSAVGRALTDAGITAATASRVRLLRPLLAPLPIRPRSVRRVRNVAYGPHRLQRLDVYRRRGAAVRGTLVYLHGGGYSSGRKHWEARALLHHFASEGWVCISADYRLRPGAGIADHLDDARSVVTWAHAHAGDHGGDPGTLVMVGSSAGAHLTALCALTQEDQPDRGASRIDAAVGLYGYYGPYDGADRSAGPVSSPLRLRAASAPPFFLVHGDHDSWVPVELAREFVRHLRADSRQAVVYAELPGAQHGFDLFRSWRFTAVLTGLDAFVRNLPGSARTGPG
ncbi:alpha/beta hydrolase [Aeromicrobium marinum]|nr:alpha/beta hydrolase [Aeromicrobium marinum]